MLDIMTGQEEYELRASKLRPVVRNEAVWETVPRKVHVESRNDGGGCCGAELIHFHKSGEVVNRNQVVDTIQREEVGRNALPWAVWEWQRVQWSCGDQACPAADFAVVDCVGDLTAKPWPPHCCPGTALGDALMTLVDCP